MNLSIRNTSILVNLPAAIVAALLLSAGRAPAGNAVFPTGAGKPNPHAAFACAECHKTVPMRGSTMRPDILKGLAAEPVALCKGCHEKTDENHHPVRSSKERRIPEGLPVSKEGDITCSTCHDLHAAGGIPSLLRGFDNGLYQVRMDMCLDCHGKQFGEINPHKVGGEREKCYTCHPTIPVPRDEGGEVVLQADLAHVCNFCHNVAQKGHPLNVDPAKVLPPSLPTGKGKTVMCGTCHDPHGTETTIHFLRAAYVEHLEAGRYANPHGAVDYVSCQGCHTAISSRKEEMRRNIRYGGDDILLCLSCHGAMDSCHPILVKPGKGMDVAGLPLSADGKIKCTTCHDPMPPQEKGVGLRGRAAGDSSNTFCFRCHEKSDLAGRNPHHTMSDRSTCKFCHDTMTDPRNDEAARVSFISNTRLICLRCHAQSDHPSNANHMVRPKMSIPEPLKLDGKGKVTCTTCHNPHIETEKKSGHRYAVEADEQSICRFCHRR